MKRNPSSAFATPGTGTRTRVHSNPAGVRNITHGPAPPSRDTSAFKSASPTDDIPPFFHPQPILPTHPHRRAHFSEACKSYIGCPIASAVGARFRARATQAHATRTVRQRHPTNALHLR